MLISLLYCALVFNVINLGSGKAVCSIVLRER